MRTSLEAVERGASEWKEQLASSEAERQRTEGAFAALRACEEAGGVALGESVGRVEESCGYAEEAFGALWGQVEQVSLRFRYFCFVALSEVVVICFCSGLGFRRASGGACAGAAACG